MRYMRYDVDFFSVDSNDKKWPDENQYSSKRTPASVILHSVSFMKVNLST